MGQLINVGAQEIVRSKLRQSSKTGVVNSSDLEEYWALVLTATAREEYREQARACIEAVAERLTTMAAELAS
jgi:hypothetical protein